MKKSLTTLLLVFLIAGFAQAQFSSISGKVTLDAQPMADFGIWVSYNDSDPLPIETELDGTYFIPAFPAIFHLATIDTFLYNPLSYDVEIEYAQHEICDFKLTLRDQDAAVTGNVSFKGFGVETTVYFLKISDDVDLDDFREVETHFDVPNIAKKWASYSIDSDANGDFSLGMLFGKYVLYIESGEETLAHWGAIHVQGDMTIDPPIILKEKKLLSGTVFNADKYYPVQILAHSLNSGRPYTATPDMVTGEYIMEVAQGDYILRCQAFFEDAEGNNYMYMVFYDGVYHVEDATIVSVQGDVDGKDFNLPDTVLNLYSVSGTVTSATTGNPIVEATVSFVSCNLYSNLWQWHTATTDDKGDYTMYGKTILPEDSLIGFAFADNFFGEFYKDAATHINATPIVVHPNDEITGKDFSLEPIDTTDAYSISGILYDEDGNIIPQGQVTAFTTATSVGVISTQVDTNGIYDFGTIFPSGSTVYLQAWGGYGYKVEIYENAECWDDENVKPIEIDSSNVTIDFELEKTGPARFPLAQIRGTVNPSSGQGLAKAGEANPLEGAVIYVKPQPQEPTDTEWTNVSYIDNNGNFNLGVDDAVSTYQIMVTARGYETYTDSNVQSSDILSILLQPTAIGDTPSDPVINSYKLFRAYPNPFNPTTTIRVEMAKTADASLVIYNVMGQKVKTLHSGSLEKGTKNFKWNGTDNAGKQVASGLYFYQLKTTNNMQTKSVIFLK